MIPPLAVVFDLDGTLIDCRGDIVASLNHALQRTGRVALPAQLIVRNVGDGARTLISRSTKLPDDSREVDELLALFLAYYKAHPIDFTRWIEGAREVLELLATMPDLSLALCTNKPREVTDAVLSALDITGYFAATFAGGDLPTKKPSPEPLLHLAERLSLLPASIVMVGDGPQDIESARAAGMRSVAIEGGYVRLERVLAACPDVVLGSITELPDIIGRWRDATARLPTPTRPRKAYVEE